MRFVIYRNSILATICSMFGAAFIAMAVMSMINGELGILSGIGALAFGVGLMCLAGFISERKEKRKRAKAAAAGGRNVTAATAGASSNAGRASVQKPSVASYASAPVNHGGSGKSLSKPIVIAAVCFLLVPVLGIATNAQYNIHHYYSTLYGHNYTDMWHTVEYGACILMMIACFITKRKQEVSAVHALGFLGLFASRALGALNKLGLLRHGHFHGLLLDVEMPPIYEAAAFLLMLIFALVSLPKVKRKAGGITKIFWWLPTLLMLPGCVIFFETIELSGRITSLINNHTLNSIPFILDLLYQLMMVMAVVFTGFAFQRACRNPEACAETAQSYAQPEPVSSDMEFCSSCGHPNKRGSAFCADCGQRIAAPTSTKPEPKPQPEPPRQSRTISDAERLETEKKRQAYKDLLDCGILTQEEYNQKIRELMG